MTSLHPLPTLTTSTIAVKSLQGFKDDLQEAIRDVFPSSNKLYERALFIIMKWDDLETDQYQFAETIGVMEKFFAKSYGYEVIDMVLKTRQPAQDRRADAIGDISIMIKPYRKPDDLIIFYYGGHALLSEKHETLVTNSSRSFDQSLNLTAVLEATLNHHRQDVIYLIDGCYAGSAMLNTGKEVLASSAVEVPSTGLITGFTRQIVDILEEQDRAPITVAHLHAKLLQVYRGPGNTRMGLDIMPVHSELNRDQKGSLVIAPLNPHGSTRPQTHLQQLMHTPLLHRDEPKVLISVHLSDLNSIPDLQTWIQWLLRSETPYIRKGEIAVESAYPTSSLLVMFMIPAAVHNTMRSHPAYQLIGYVAGDNVMASLPSPISSSGQRKELRLADRPSDLEDIESGTSGTSMSHGVYHTSITSIDPGAKGPRNVDSQEHGGWVVVSL
ncbi:MAG: hypothetical protein Q9170_000597 [Blastenia crenularia]